MVPNHQPDGDIQKNQNENMDSMDIEILNDMKIEILKIPVSQYPY